MIIFLTQLILCIISRVKPALLLLLLLLLLLVHVHLQALLHLLLHPWLGFKATPEWWTIQHHSCISSVSYCFCPEQQLNGWVFINLVEFNYKLQRKEILTTLEENVIKMPSSEYWRRKNFPRKLEVQYDIGRKYLWLADRCSEMKEYRGLWRSSMMGRKEMRAEVIQTNPTSTGTDLVGKKQ